MGHDVQQYAAKLSIKMDMEDAACEALRKSDIGLGFSEDDTLEDMFHEIGWHYEEPRYFERIDSKLHSKSGEFFSIIAPFVDPHSYVTMIDQDLKIWRWYFIEDKCFYQHGEITFRKGAYSE